MMGLSCNSWAIKADFEKRITEGYVNNNGVKLHYVETGTGETLVVLLHGYPDYWYSFRDLMENLSTTYKVVALDSRGYNLSDKPTEVEKYHINFLMDDVEALIKKMGHKKAIIIGHDWGGRVGWGLAINRPQLVEKLIVLSAPHPLCFLQQLKKNKTQKSAREYVHAFFEKEHYKKLDPVKLADWVKDAEVRKKYIDAFKKSSLQSMMNYFLANNLRDNKALRNDFKKEVTLPVLQIMGAKDDKILPSSITNTWNFAKGNLTMVVIPEADHFMLQSAPEKVLQQINLFLK